MSVREQVRACAVNGQIPERDLMAMGRHVGSLHSVLDVALSEGILPERFERNPFDARAQLTLHRSKVLVAGCGALGNAVAEQLARLGVGFLRLHDPDRYDPTNLNRQIYAGFSTLGAPKVKIAASRLEDANPYLEVDARFEALTAMNAKAALSGITLVIDCLDTTTDRLMLESACEKAGIPMVHGAIAGWAGQVMVAAPGARVLAELYGDAPEKGAEVRQGNAIFSVFVTAGLQAAAACRLLVGGTPLSDGESLLVYDLTENDFERVTL